MSHFHPPEVVNRGSEPQLQVGENITKITWRGTQQTQHVETMMF